MWRMNNCIMRSSPLIRKDVISINVLCHERKRIEGLGGVWRPYFVRNFFCTCVSDCLFFVLSLRGLFLWCSHHHLWILVDRTWKKKKSFFNIGNKNKNPYDLCLYHIQFAILFCYPFSFRIYLESEL